MQCKVKNIEAVLILIQLTNPEQCCVVPDPVSEDPQYIGLLDTESGP
jgi:hypothetical protein